MSPQVAAPPPGAPLRRTIQIDLDGEIIDMEWDKPTPPRKTDVRNWIQQRRASGDQPTSALNILNTPTRQEPLPTQAAPPSSLLEKAKSFASGIYDPIRGMASSVAETGRKGAEDILAGNVRGALGRVLAPLSDPFTKIAPTAATAIETARGAPPVMSPTEARNAALQNVGIPAPEIQAAYQAGDYPRMAGQVAGTLGMLYTGSKIGRKASEGFRTRVPPESTPNIPPTVSSPVTPPGPKPGTIEALYSKLATEDATPFKLPEQTPVNNILETAKRSPLPGMADVVARTEKVVKESSARRVAQDAAMPSMSIIKKSGPAGKPLAAMLTRTRLDGEALGAKWKQQAEKATEGLNPEQVDAYITARDTGNLPTDPMVLRALELRKILDQEVVNTVKTSGAGFRTSEGIIPFQERTNYWPHIYPKEFFANKATAIERLMNDPKNPMGIEEATKAVQNASRFGERIISPLNERQSDAPGYRRDLNADAMHLADMAQRAVEAKEFGPLDIADNSSPISELLNKTNDPARVREIVSKHLGRDVPDSTVKDWGAVSRGVMKLETMRHLSQFAISNMSQLATVPLRGNTTAYVKALAKTVKNFKEAKGEAEGTGALQTIHQDILREVGGENMVSKIYGMKTSETINRTVAALTGKGTAEQLFDTVKSSPKHTKARARLENLLLEPIDEIVKQDKLTPEQLARAGGRMAEITQGRAQGIDLPPLWSGHPAMDMLLLYKKYAFRQTQIITDAIKENPARNIPLAIALYASIGEVVGDAKAGIRGAASGQGPLQAIGARGDNDLLEKLDKPTGKIMGRVVANLGQAWALGLLADTIGAAGEGQYGMLKFAAGPVASDLTALVSAGVEGLQGNAQPLIKEAAKAVPVFGAGLAERVPPNKRRTSPFGTGGRGFGLPAPRK